MCTLEVIVYYCIYHRHRLYGYRKLYLMVCYIVSLVKALVP